MTPDEQLASEVPLVIRVVEPDRRPAPGLLEAVFWSVVFIAVQMLGAIAVAAIVLGIAAVQTDQPGQFLDDQLAGTSSATGQTPQEADQPRPPLPEEMGRALAYGMLGAQLVSLVVIRSVVPWRVGRNWRSELGFRWPSLVHLLLMVLLVPGFLVLSGGIQELVARLSGVKPPAAVEALNGVFRTVPWYIALVSVSLGPGFVEEVWCRGFLGRGLCARYGTVAGVLLTSLLFALMHLDPSQVIVITVMGAYLHVIYLMTRCIWVPITLHALNNGIALLAAQLHGPPALGDEPQGVPVVVYLVGFTLVLFASIALWTSRPLSLQAREMPAEPARSPRYHRLSRMALALTLVSLGVLMVLIM
jgi:membrane protease YdiL (CAAX protease family)